MRRYEGALVSSVGGNVSRGDEGSELCSCLRMAEGTSSSLVGSTYFFVICR